MQFFAASKELYLSVPRYEEARRCLGGSVLKPTSVASDLSSAGAENPPDALEAGKAELLQRVLERRRRGRRQYIPCEVAEMISRAMFTLLYVSSCL